MRAWSMVMLVLVSGGCGDARPSALGPKPFVECRDTITCRAMAAERERQLARAVAQEPPAVRLDVEPVSPLALVDRQRQLVYVLDPGLVALELQTGNERWRAPDASGNTLWRVGRFLAVTEGTGLPPKVTFVDIEAPTRPVTCSLALRAPSVASEAFLHLFDRAGEPYIYWMSNWSYSGGTPPSKEILERQASSEACGVLKVDPRTCAASPQNLGDFVWDPPEGRRQKPGEPDYCTYLSPLRDIPAAAAAAPRADPRTPPQAPTAHGVVLRVTVNEKPRNAMSSCVRVSSVALEAHDEAATLLWSRPLQDQQNTFDCRPP